MSRVKTSQFSSWKINTCLQIKMNKYIHIQDILWYYTPFPLYRWLSVGSVVTIRTLVGCKYRHALRAKHLGSRGFFFLWRLVWTASALDHLLICCLAPNTEDVIISSAYQRCRVHIVRYCVAAELEDFDRDSRTDGLIYMAVNLIHFRPLFLEFLRQSKTSL